MSYIIYNVAYPFVFKSLTYVFVRTSGTLGANCLNI